MGTADGIGERTRRAEPLAALAAVRDELEAISRAADEALRTGNPDRLLRYDLARAHAARDALIAACADIA